VYECRNHASRYAAPGPKAAGPSPAQRRCNGPAAGGTQKEQFSIVRRTDGPAVAHPLPAEYSGGRRWLVSCTAVAEHAFLSDCASAALVTRHGSVDWLCLPRFDSPPVLARLLDDDAGYLALRPADPAAAAAERRYLPHSLVLETTWTCSHGSAGWVPFALVGASRPSPGCPRVVATSGVTRIGKQVRASQTSWRAAVA